MKLGRSLVELAQEITRQRDTKRDFIAPSRHIGVEVQDNIPTLVLADSSGKRSLGITPTAHDQLAGRLGIPLTYYRKMQAEAPALLAENANTWLQRGGNERSYMVRSLDGNARALLSDRYRPLDYAELAEVALPALKQAGCEVVSCEVTERQLYIKAVSAKVTGKLKVGDAVQAGVCIGTSEIGLRSLYANSFAYILSCLNGAQFQRTFSRRHIGARMLEGEVNWDDYTSSTTRRLNSAVIWSAFRDYMNAALNEDVFRSRLSLMDAAAEDKFSLPAPEKVVEVLQSHEALDLSEKESSSVLQFLCKGGDFSRWGLSQAITRASQEVESYDRATEMEVAGGRVIEMPRSDWASIVSKFEDKK